MVWNSEHRLEDGPGRHLNRAEKGGCRAVMKLPRRNPPKAATQRNGGQHLRRIVDNRRGNETKPQSTSTATVPEVCESAKELHCEKQKERKGIRTLPGCQLEAGLDLQRLGTTAKSCSVEARPKNSSIVATSASVWGR